MRHNDVQCEDLDTRCPCKAGTSTHTEKAKRRLSELTVFVVQRLFLGRTRDERNAKCYDTNAKLGILTRYFREVREFVKEICSTTQDTT